MTRTTNARIAGFTFLLYLAAGIAGMVLFGRATSGEVIAAKLASIAEHAMDVRVANALSLLTSCAALVLARDAVLDRAKSPPTSQCWP